MENKLTFFYGPMGSAKSLRLLTMAYNFEEKNIQFIVIKPSLDNRDGETKIHSRVGLERECVPIDKETNIYKAIKAYKNFLMTQFETLKYVLVDEAQFLTEEQINQLSDVVDFLDINVICFGLRTDFQSHLFSGSKRLFEIADEIHRISSVCECGEHRASVNARFDENGEIVTDGEQLVIGGNEKYRAICRKCWKDKVREKENKENG